MALVTITHELNGRFTGDLCGKPATALNCYKPNGCPFDGYSLLNLVGDLICMYGWKIHRGQSMSLSDFIRLLQRDRIEKAIVYGDDIISLVENY